MPVIVRGGAGAERATHGEGVVVAVVSAIVSSTEYSSSSHLGTSRGAKTCDSPTLTPLGSSALPAAALPQDSFGPRSLRVLTLLDTWHLLSFRPAVPSGVNPTQRADVRRDHLASHRTLLQDVVHGVPLDYEVLEVQNCDDARSGKHVNGHYLGNGVAL